MNREELREKLALQLYGELSEAEDAELERVLATDAESRRFAAELKDGLGRLVPGEAAAPLSEAWEEEWSQRLRAAIETAATTYSRSSQAPVGCPPRRRDGIT